MILRPATPNDAQAMSDLLNALIAKGDSTAHRSSFDAPRMIAHYIAPTGVIASTVAYEDDALVGFQMVRRSQPKDPLPENWGVIASFVAPNAHGKGVGRALFAITEAAARDAGLTAIDATIRADNAGGLGYYSAMGFGDYDEIRGATLSDGTPANFICKRFDLRAA